MTRPARVPADVNRPDRVLGPFTTRQSVLLLATAAVLYGAWVGLRPWVPLPIFLTVAAPVAAIAVVVALGQRDGLPLDRFLLAGLRHHLNPRRMPATPRTGAGHSGQPSHGAAFDPNNRLRTAPTAVSWRPGPAGLLAQAHTAGLGPDPAGPGVLDLGADGLVAIAAVSTLNLGLHTPTEQDALLTGFARYLHTLTGPVQFLIRTVPLDLGEHLSALYEQARTLPHPALVTAALGHRAHLAHLATPAMSDGETDGGDGLTARQVLLVFREATAGTGGQQLLRRLEDATRHLATLDIAITPLDAAQISALLTDCCNPTYPTTGPPHPGSSHSAAPPAPAPRPPVEPGPGNQLPLVHQMPLVPNEFTPIDVAFENDGCQDWDEGRRTYAQDNIWFDDRTLPHHHPSFGYGGGAPNVAGDTDTEFDELDPGAAQWWGR
jgi:hypothetical protein